MSDVVCVIPTLGRPDLAFRVVQQLLAQTIRPAAVIVVDASPEESFDALRVRVAGIDNGDVIHQQAREASLTAQRNQGIDIALGLGASWTHLQFMDDDVWFGDDYLARALEAAKAGDWSGLCGATDAAKARDDASAFERFFSLAPPAAGKISVSGRNAGFEYDPDAQTPVRAQWILGCALYQRDIVEAQRFWEQPGYVLFEDVEFSSRVVRSGGAVAWLPSLKLEHLELSRSEVAHERAAYQSVYNRAKVLDSMGRRLGTPFWWSVVGLCGRSVIGTLMLRSAARLRARGYVRAVRDCVRDFMTTSP